MPGKSDNQVFDKMQGSIAIGVSYATIQGDIVAINQSQSQSAAPLIKIRSKF